MVPGPFQLSGGGSPGPSNVSLASFDGTTWTAFTPLAAGSTDRSPALASYNGKLYSAHRDLDQGLHWNRLDGTTWSGYTAFPPARAVGTPALATYNGKLFCLVRRTTPDMWGTLGLSWASFDGTRWSAFSQLSNTAGYNAPALAVHDNKLYVAYRGDDNAVY
jgi:hypothetical protein